MPTPAQVLAQLTTDDAAAPRITCYDDLPGPTQGERIELSARVLSTWVSKAANALQEEWDIEPGSVVQLALPAHWRLLYWAWAVWSVGGQVDLDGKQAADLVVTDNLACLSASSPGVLVTRGALARSAGVELPSEVMDEAADLASFGDDFSPWQEPALTDLAVSLAGQDLSYADAVAAATDRYPVQREARLHVTDPSPASLISIALATWSVGGSLVVQLGEIDESARQRRASTEGVTAAAH